MPIRRRGLRRKRRHFEIPKKLPGYLSAAGFFIIKSLFSAAVKMCLRKISAADFVKAFYRKKRPPKKRSAEKHILALRAYGYL